jgi:transposase
VELYERIRRDRRDEEASVRELARRYRVHRRTVHEALGSAEPRPRKTPERESPALGPWKPVIRGWLETDVKDNVPRKQRHTARRVWQRLEEEHGAQVSESSVRGYVAEVRAELANTALEVTVAQEHAPGEDAEVDFGEFRARIDGQMLVLQLFIMRLSASGRGFAMAFVHQAQEAFLEGHVLAFAHFGGVPTGLIRYDNLKAAVLRVVVGRERVINERFIALRSHYLFDSFFCMPGEKGAHEKGGVEGEVGRFRRRHLVPIPAFDTVDDLNAFLVEAMTKDDERHVGRRVQTVGEAFAVEQRLLRPLPDEPFDCSRMLEAKVDAKARICVLQSFYSVPVRLARRRVPVRLGARHLEVLDPTSGAVVARHIRSAHKGSQDLQLDHYLEILAFKPGAMAGSTALAQAKKAGVLTEVHERFWAAARRERGDAAGTRALIEVLLLHRRMPAADVLAGMEAVLKVGSSAPELVAIEARRVRDADLAPVIPIESALGRYDRPAPALAGYDQLLAVGTSVLPAEPPVIPPVEHAATVTPIGDRS